MLEGRSFENFFKQFSSALPRGAAELQADFEKNVRIALNAALARMDLVTREEFEVQTAVLMRTRSKLEALEKRVAELEAAANIPPETTE